ncbi:cAMP-binding protein [Echinicola pacifica]|uniref:cAMP-binding protein n=1 Tax=Echinicola pacifica TaxID=346377 RepID=A0A918UTT6_9BACT|nr:Crp/Fnr family transcriptional regulator [Echinicola pacifica]GGZ32616.1 cAMP-binding protein [Echinicola pacifica]
MHLKLHQNILQHIKMTEEEMILFDSYWTERVLQKGEYLLRNGELSITDNYVVSGALKAFYINPTRGTEEILFFAIEDWWATDLLSFNKQKPSNYTIQALETTHIIQIHRQAFQDMLASLPQLERYFRIILESYLGSLQRRIIVQNTMAAEERYHDFIAHYPLIAQKVPQYLIASYLGISPEFISRIKNK